MRFSSYVHVSLVCICCFLASVQCSDVPRKYNKNRPRYTQPQSEYDPNQQTNQQPVEYSNTNIRRSDNNNYEDGPYPPEQPERPYSKSNYEEGSYPADPEKPTDIVKKYTSTISSRVLVAISSSALTALLLSLLFTMLTSNNFPNVVGPMSLLMGFMSFAKISDVSDLSRSLGVLLIILLRRYHFLPYVRAQI